MYTYEHVHPCDSKYLQFNATGKFFFKSKARGNKQGICTSLGSSYGCNPFRVYTSSCTLSLPCLSEELLELLSDSKPLLDKGRPTVGKVCLTEASHGVCNLERVISSLWLASNMAYIFFSIYCVSKSCF